MPQFTSKFKSIPLSEKLLVFLGGFGLTFIAGYVNIIAITLLDVPVSHMSGAVSRLSSDIAAGQTLDLFHIFMIVFGFLFGAIASGIIIGNAQLKPGRRYGIVLMIEGTVLTVASYLIGTQKPGGIILASAACGIQNAMATSYYGLVIRTTHVTGIVTDLGVLIGYWIKYRRVQFWKMLLLLVLLLGFALGGYSGWNLYQKYGTDVLYFISISTFIAGTTYFIWRNLNKRKL